MTKHHTPSAAVLIHRPGRDDNRRNNRSHATAATITHHLSHEAALAAAPDHLTWDTIADLGYLVAADRFTGGTWLLVDQPVDPTADIKPMTAPTTRAPRRTISSEDFERGMRAYEETVAARATALASKPIRVPKPHGRPRIDDKAVARLRNDGLNRTQIAARLHVGPSSVTRAIRRLQQEGVIQ